MSPSPSSAPLTAVFSPPCRPSTEDDVTPEADQLPGVRVLVVRVERLLPEVLVRQLAFDVAGRFGTEHRPLAGIEHGADRGPGQDTRAFHHGRGHAVGGFDGVEVAVLVLDRGQSVVGVVRHLAERRADIACDGAEDRRARRLDLILCGGVGLALARLRDRLCLERRTTGGSYGDSGAGVLLELGRGAGRVGDGLGDGRAQRWLIGRRRGGWGAGGVGAGPAPTPAGRVAVFDI